MARVPLLALALAASVMAGAAHADPVRITGGALRFDFEGDFFEFLGSDFALRGALPESRIPTEFPGHCFPCRAGIDVIDYSFTTTGGEVFIGSGPATFAGQSYDQVYYRAQLAARAAARTFPTDLGPAGAVDQDFVLTGSLRAFVDPDFSTLAFATAVTGRGRAHQVWILNEEVNAYDPEEGQFPFFFSPAQPVPEPATMTLVGLGLAGLALRRRRSRPEGHGDSRPV